MTRKVILKVIKDIQLTTLTPVSPSVSKVPLQRKLPGKSLTSGLKKPSRTTNDSLNSGVISVSKELPIFEAHVSDLVEYLDFLQVTHDYAYKMLCMHASTICSILQPTECMRDSTAHMAR